MPDRVPVARAVGTEPSQGDRNSPDAVFLRRGEALVRTPAPHGLYHCVGSGHATWLDVTRELAERLGVQPAIRGITLDELNLR